MLSVSAIKRVTEEIAREIIGPNADEVDKEAIWPAEGIRVLLDQGLGSLVVSESYGGQGQGTFALAQVCETLGGQCASTAICFGMHSVGASVIAANPTPDQCERYLEPIVAGKHRRLTRASVGCKETLTWTGLTCLRDQRGDSCA